MRPLTPDQFDTLFLEDRPLLDVRAPVEFAEGAFPSAHNIPLLDDQQRHDIGKRYADAGQDEAIRLGLELATPEIRQHRLDAWQTFIREHPDGALYCFRGGLRSRTTQQWLADAGLDYPLIQGGYKALRRHLLERLDHFCQNAPLQVVAGPTGSGKTDLILAWPHSLDLEGLAHHKGSAFGQEFRPQPTQIDWENRLSVHWLQRQHRNATPVLVEDESRLIGRIYVPGALQERLHQAPEIRLHASLSERIQRLRRDYVQPIITAYQQRTPENPWPGVEQHIQENLQRIRKRLGGARHHELESLLATAVQALSKQNDWAPFDELIAALLTGYYDPMYQYQLKYHQRTQVFSGSLDEALAWLKQEGTHAFA